MSPKTRPGETRERVYQFVREQLLQGLPPTVREVCDAMGFRAVETARGHLEKLVAEGRLVKQPGKSRGYGLPEHASQSNPPTRFVPLLGRVQAGALTTAVEDREGYIPVNTTVSGELFALRVRGESMIGKGIMPGDVVIVRHQPTATPGEIVVAIVGDEATVKTLRIRQGVLELHPENPSFQTIVPDPNDCVILGKVVEVRRYMDNQVSMGPGVD